MLRKFLKLVQVIAEVSFLNRIEAFVSYGDKRYRCSPTSCRDGVVFDLAKPRKERTAMCYI